MGHNDPFTVTFTTRLIVKFSYFVIFFFGYCWELVESILSKLSLLTDTRGSKPGYAPLFNDFSAFYTRHLYGRIKDCWNRPISSLPGAYIDIIEREGTPFLDNLKPTGRIQRCLNLGSYNYLGFSENSICIEKDVEAVEKYASSICSPRLNYGTLDLHRELEKTVAGFLGKEDAVVFGMGFSTNSTTMTALAGEGSLIISDALNHASLIVGYRNSGASNAVFQHNDPVDLERVLKKSIREGNPKTKKPWAKIIIVVEGLYSMEGTICRLPEFIELKKKYKAYLYVDEAHSIGALGKTGRGVSEYFGVSTADIDILMGTFTKSFASAGGYLASSKAVVDAVRAESFGSVYDVPITPGCAEQILTSWNLMRGPEGTDEVGISRMERLRRNSLYVRPKLKEQGFLVAGDDDSPIIPILMYSPIIVSAFSRRCLEHNIAVVVVGFPATDLYTCRVRLCMSAVHTLEELEKALKAISYFAEECAVRKLK